MTTPQVTQSGSVAGEAEIARGLTKAMRSALLNAYVCDDGGARLDCRKYYPPTIDGLERRKLTQFASLLTPLGIRVRAILTGDEQS